MRAWRPVGQNTALDGFQLSLDGFEGPLDLLLHLIDREGLDITGVSVLAITDQFAAYVGALNERFADAASEFLLVGSLLTMLKSRALLPAPERLLDEETVEDLAQRLRVYAAFKDIAIQLDTRLETGVRSFIRLAAPIIWQPPLEPGAGDVDALVRAVEHMLAAQRGIENVVFTQPVLRYRVADKIENLRSRLALAGRLPFAQVAAECQDRMEVIVVFLAVLHLVHQRLAVVIQRSAFGPMELQAVPAHV